MQYRQGDVFIEEIEELPLGCTLLVPNKPGRIVLAEGEVTGHAHILANPQAHLYAIAHSEDRVLVIDAPIHGEGSVGLVHEEHGTIMLPPRVYRVRRQREYTPSAIRRVSD